MTDIHVVVTENTQPHKIGDREELFYDDKGSMVFEQYVEDADIESIKNKAKSLEPRYGKCRIARLEFVDV